MFYETIQKRKDANKVMKNVPLGNKVMDLAKAKGFTACCDLFDGTVHMGIAYPQKPWKKIAHFSGTFEQAIEYLNNYKPETKKTAAKSGPERSV